MEARSQPSSTWAEAMLGAFPERSHASTTSAQAPAAASLGLASWLCADPRPAVVLGTSTRFAWCALEDEVVLLGSPGAVRFPNSVLADGAWGALEPGDPVLIGSGAVRGAGFDWRAVRWWDPRPTPIESELSDVMAQVESLARRVAPRPLGVETVLASRDRNGVIEVAAEMLGAGNGLTPEADDVLIGALATYRHVAASLGRPKAGEFICDVADGLIPMARRRTTLLSATLLNHACAGEVPDPLADLMLAVTGMGSTSAALQRCLAIGGSSGRAMARGVVVGARAACGVSL